MAQASNTLKGDIGFGLNWKTLDKTKIANQGNTLQNGSRIVLSPQPYKNN